MVAILYTFSLFCLLFSPSFAQEVKSFVLFKEGVPSVNYNTIMRGIEDDSRLSRAKFENVILRFSNKSFLVKRFLGSGSTTMVFEIDGNKVLRVEKEILESTIRNRRSLKEVGNTYIEAFTRGYSELKNSEVRVVKIYESTNEYIVNEKVLAPEEDLIELYKNSGGFSRKGDRLTAQDFLRVYSLKSSNKNIELSETENQMYKSLLKFIMYTWDFKYIDDFRSEQILWNGKEWVLADWTGLHIKYSLDELNKKVKFSDEIKKLSSMKIASNTRTPVMNFFGQIEQDDLKKLHSNLSKKRIKAFQKRTSSSKNNCELPFIKNSLPY